VNEGAEYDTVAVVELLIAAMPIVGVPGVEYGTMLLLALLLEPLPAMLFATTVNV
jgi:hypothetical protein